MKRWLSFILLISAVLILSTYMFLIDQTDSYTPSSSDPAAIYLETCARCHGKRGEGSALLYPGLSGNRDNSEEVRDIVRNGASFMPAFPNIPDSILIGLADYVAGKKYLNRTHDDL